MWMKYGVLVEVEPAGVIRVTQPIFSRSSDSYFLPPPTTLVGALAYGYLRSKHILMDVVYKDGNPYSPAILILDRVLYACAGAEPVYTYVRQQERVSTIIYQREVRRRVLAKISLGEQLSKREENELENALRLAFDVVTRGTSLFDRLYLFYVLADKELVRGLYGIIRIGMKEGLVAVNRVEVFDNIGALATDKRVSINTIFYAPRNIVVGALNGIKVSMPIIHEHNFGKFEVPVQEDFYVPAPYSISQMIVDLRANGVALYLKDLDTHIVLPKEYAMP